MKYRSTAPLEVAEPERPYASVAVTVSQYQPVEFALPRQGLPNDQFPVKPPLDEAQLPLGDRVKV